MEQDLNFTGQTLNDDVALDNSKTLSGYGIVSGNVSRAGSIQTTGNLTLGFFGSTSGFDFW
jgi:hypothetical protein